MWFFASAFFASSGIAPWFAVLFQQALLFLLVTENAPLHPFHCIHLFILFGSVCGYAGILTSACLNPGLNLLFPLFAQHHPVGPPADSFHIQSLGRFSSFMIEELSSWLFRLRVLISFSLDFLVSTKPRQRIRGSMNQGYSIPFPFSSPACFICRGLRLAAGVQLTGLHRAACQRNVRASREIRYPA